MTEGIRGENLFAQEDVGGSRNDLSMAGEITAIAAAPDGTALFTAHADGSIRLWSFLESASERRYERGGAAVYRDNIIELRTLGTVAGALGRDTRNTVWYISAIDRHPDRIAEGVVGMATSARGAFAALIRENDKGIGLYRVGAGGQLLLKEDFREPSASAVAVTADGLETAIGTSTGGLVRRKAQESRQVLLSAGSGNAIKAIAYDYSEAWLIVLRKGGEKGGDLLAIPRDAVAGAAPRVLATNISDFDVRRVPGGKGVPVLIATGADGVLTWSEQRDEGHPSLGTAHAVVTSITPKHILFDPWGSRTRTRAFLIDGDQGQIDLAAIATDDGKASVLGSLYPTRKIGWAVVDAAGRYDGDGATISAIRRKQNFHKIDQDWMHLLTRNCERGELLRELRYADAPAPHSAPCPDGGTVPSVQIGEPRPVPSRDRNEELYDVEFKVLRNGYQGQALGEPTLVLQGRALKKHPNDCRDDQAGRFCHVQFRAIPGIKNTLQVEVESSGRIFYSPQRSFVTRASARVPVVRVVTFGVSSYGNPCPDKVSTEKALLCDLGGIDQELRGLQAILASAFGSERGAVPVQTVNRCAAGISTVAGRTRSLVTYELLGSAANKSCLDIVLGQIADDAYPEDTLWLVLAGHGTTLDAGYAEEQFYLATQGARYPLESYITGGDPASRSERPDLIASSWLATRLAAIDAREIAVILDTCYAGGARSAMETEAWNSMRRGDGPLGVEFLFASTPNEAAYSERNFIGFISDRIRQAADRREGLFASELFSSAARTDGGYSDGKYSQYFGGIGSDVLLLPAH
jgi:hypothetical protein